LDLGAVHDRRAAAAGGASAFAQQKLPIERWLDGEVKANLPPASYCGPPIQLKFNSFLPPTASPPQLQMRTFKRLEADTNGRIVIRGYWGSTLANAQRGAFDAIASGIAETGTCFAIMNPGSGRPAGCRCNWPRRWAPRPPPCKCPSSTLRSKAG
jgi:TRAP-type C4-dicarboxylate transport system substrate-binding protein